MRQISSLFAFNRGLIDPRGLARVDIPKLKMAAEIMTNWVARVLGSMSIRAGTSLVNQTHNNYPTKLVEFIHSNADTALLAFDQPSGAGVPGGNMGVMVNGVELLQQVYSSPASFPAFAAGLSGWTNTSTTGGSATGTTNFCTLKGDGFTAQGAIQISKTLSAGVETRIQFTVYYNPVHFRVGSTSGNDDYLTDTVLPPGTYNFGVKAGLGAAYYQFLNTALVGAVLGNILVTNPTSGTAQPVLIPHALNIPTMQWDQSADVVFMVDGLSQQIMVQRRNQIGGAGVNTPDSWGIALYQPNDGPFQVQNTGGIQLKTSALGGSGVTLTSSLPLFHTGHVGCLFALTSNGQTTYDTLTTAGNDGDSIMVTGVGAARQFALQITITGTIHIQLQQSLDQVSWSVASGGTYTVGDVSDFTASYSGSYTDGLDNEIVYYRLACITSSGGSAICVLLFSNGFIRGICRCTVYGSETTMTVDVLTNMGQQNQFTTDWEQGYWCPLEGYPSAVKLAEGRLWFGGQSTIFGSVSDAYASFDETITGDSGPLIRTIASGPIDIVTWFVPLQRLLFGTPDKEWAISASSLDIPITPSQYNCKPIGTQGSTQVPALQLDNYGIFVDRSNTRVLQLAFNLQIYNYAASSLMLTNPYLGQASAENWNTDSGIVRLAIQRKPDTRIHCVRSDGVVLVLVFDDAEQVQSWQIFEAAAGGLIEDVAVLPAEEGQLDDNVYWVVKRTVGGSTVRTIELMAQEAQTYGGSGNNNILADACYFYSGSPTASFTGMTWMAGEQVAVWADGNDVGTDDSVVPFGYLYTVASDGSLTLPADYSNVCIGLPYTATWKSAKLGMATSEEGTPLNHPKSVKQIGLVMYNTHSRGIQYSSNGATYYDIPNIQGGVPTFGPIGLPNSYEIIQEYDYDQFSFPGQWDTDSRIWLLAHSPRPVTAMALSMSLEMG